MTLVDAAPPTGQPLPTIGMLADGDYLLFTPTAAGRDYGVRRAPAPLVGEPPLPPGETGQPRADGPPCPEVQQAVEEEALFDPRLVTWDGRTFLVFVSEVVRTSRRFGPVPRTGKTPAEDRLTCGWIVDSRRSEVSLVLGEVTATGALKERLRAAVDLVPSDGVHGLRNLVAVEGDELWVASSALGALTFTRFDLAASSGP